MAQRQTQKVKGCRKCGRTAKKGLDLNISLFIRGKISAEDYFKATKQAFRKN